MAAVSRVYLTRRPFLVAGAVAAFWTAAPASADESADAPLLEAAPAETVAAEPVTVEVAASSAPAEVVAAAPAPIAPAPAPAISALEMQTLALVNGARVSRGLPALEWDPTMAEAARGHAADMARRGVVSHQGADGSTPNDRLRRAGVKFRFGSENIWTYWGRVADQGPSTMHAAMMAEPHAPGLWNHIGNILYTGYRRIGIGIVTNANGVQYLSEKFAD